MWAASAVMSDKPVEDFASLFEAETRGRPEQRARPLALGERCRAEVVQVGRDGVFVEILDRSAGGKRPQAFIAAEERRAGEAAAEPKLGEVIEAVVVAIDER